MLKELFQSIDKNIFETIKIVINKTSSGGVEFECHSDNSQVTTPITIPSSSDFTQIHEILFEKSLSGSIKCGGWKHNSSIK